MERRPLGGTGLNVPRLGLGTVKIGRNQGVKYPEPFELPGDAEVEKLLHAAMEEGVTLWDTAPAYGRAEERLGPYVERHRDEIVLCSKAGESFGPEGSRYDFRGEALRRSVEESLRRLRTDHLDLLLLHSDGRDVERLREGDAVATLHALREEGMARAVGISAKTAEGIRLASESLDVVMAPYHREGTELGEALAGASAAGRGILVIKALGQGHAVVGSDPREELARQLGFVLDQDFVDCAVLGTARAEHLRQWVRALQGHRS